MASNGYGLLECKIRAMIRAISELWRGGLESLALTGICLSRQVLRGETRVRRRIAELPSGGPLDKRKALRPMGGPREAMPESPPRLISS
jgi:hypothetical protein